MPDRRQILGSALAASAGIFAQVAPERAWPAASAGTAQPIAARRAIGSYADAHFASRAIPGGIVSFVDATGADGAVEIGHADLARGVRVRPTHLFQIGSISKSFTALCIFRLIEARRLGLDTRLSDILPELRFDAAADISVQHLLNHSAGLPSDAPLTPKASGQVLWSGFSPGTRSHYSNTGYALLGLVIAAVTRQPFAKALRSLILDPLAMHSTRAAIIVADRPSYATGYGPCFPDRPFPIGAPSREAPWVNVTAANGSIASTGADMAKYIRCLIALGQGRPTGLLAPSLGRQFCAQTIAAPSWGDDAGYANGLAVVRHAGRSLLHHTGGMIAFSSSLHVDIEAGVGAFASANIGHPTYRPQPVTLFACDWLRAAQGGHGIFPDPVDTPGTSPVADFADTYRDARGNALVVAARGSALTLTTKGKSIKFVADGALRFVASQPEETPFPLVFTGRNGAAARLWWGPSEFVRISGGADSSEFSAPPAPAIAALAGTYDCDDPWYGTVNIYCINGMLWLDGAGVLTPNAAGHFVIGDEMDSPERIAFHCFIAGTPQILDISGVQYRRCDLSSA